MGWAKTATAFAAATFALATTPAAAQQMVGHLNPQLYADLMMQMNQGNNACGPMPQKEIDEARKPAPAIMQAYFKSAQAGEPVSPHFKLTKRTQWTAGKTIAGRESLDAQRDPLAVEGHRLDPETLRFFRAGTHQTALGQWMVMDANNNVAGVYTAMFERQKGEWKLLKLEVFEHDDRVSPIMHYCSIPGDLDMRKVDALTARYNSIRRRYYKRADRLGDAAKRAYEARANAKAKPRSKGAAKRVKERAAQLAKQRKSFERAFDELQEAVIDLRKARRELRQMRSNTTLARNAKAWRFIDDEGKRIGG